VFFGTSSDLYRIKGKTPSVISTGLHTDASRLYSDNSRLFVATDDTLRWSDDLGASWNTTTYPNVTINDAITLNNNILLATNQSGLIRQNGGTNNWVSSNLGLSSAPMADATSFTVTSEDSVFAGVSYYGVKKYEGYGIWSYIGPDSMSITSVASQPDGTVYALIGNSLYRRSTQNYTWQKTNLSDMSGFKMERLFIPANGILYLQSNEGNRKPLYRSADNGAHWDSLFPGAVIQQLISDGNDRLYATMNGTLYTSSDSGSSWQSLAPYSQGSTIESMNKWGSDSLLAGTKSNGVYLITSHGTDWIILGNPGENIGLVTGDTNGYVFVYSLANKEAYTWNRNNPKWRIITFPDLSIRSNLSSYRRILIDDQHKVIVWGKDRGIFRSNISTHILPVTQDHTNLTSQFALLQNYPNQFNPTTTIRYMIPTRAHVRLTIYNVLGQRVETLVNKEEVPGQYSVQFNALKLGSGVYLYRLRAGAFVETKKLVVIK